MKYLTRIHGKKEVEEISKEKAKWYLEAWYTADSVEDIFENEKGFRLYTPTRDIWTMDDTGGHKLVPMPGFYGIVG